MGSLTKARKNHYSWYSVSSLIWILIIAWQWTHYVEDFWYHETVLLVLYTLCAAAIIEALPIWAILRWLLKAVTITYILQRILIQYDVYAPYGTFTDRVNQFIDNSSEYIWFALAAWAIFELIIRLVTNKGMILVFIGGNILAFAILDSFTRIYLWTEIAWTVFAGMAWLVCNHFRRFQLNHPNGFSNVRRRPLKVLVNVTVIFAAVLLIGVNVPSVSPILTDPYSLWQSWKGSSSHAGGDSGSGEKNKISRSSSGYSRDDSELGRGFNFDSTPVMTVTSNQRSYWRGETREYYTGKGWLGYDFKVHNETTVNSGDLVVNDQLGGINTVHLKQTVTMMGKDRYPVLFGAYSISKIDIPEAGTDGMSPKLSWDPAGAEMRWNGFESSNKGSSKYPSQYEVESEVPDIPINRLKSASYDELYSGEVRQQYLQLPKNFPDRVKSMAEQISATGNTPYEKVELIRNYLQSNYTYTNKPDLSRKVSDDFVESFLFDMKEGYCDYFSTSMVMMARSIGIPARWVKGYAPGSTGEDQMEFQRAQQAGATKKLTDEVTYTVTNADAHSWAEIYYGGTYGWVPVEATPGFTMPVISTMEEAEPVMQEETQTTPEEEEPAKTAQPKVEDSIDYSVWIWAAEGIIAAWLAYILIRHRNSIYFGFLKMRQGRELTAGEKVVVESWRWERLMRRNGYGRQNHETLREAAERWIEADPETTAPLKLLLQQFERARYSPKIVGADEWQRTRHLTKLLRHNLKATRQKRKASST